MSHDHTTYTVHRKAMLYNVLEHYVHAFNDNRVAVRTYALLQTPIPSSGMCKGRSVTAPRPILTPRCSTWR